MDVVSDDSIRLCSISHIGLHWVAVDGFVEPIDGLKIDGPSSLVPVPVPVVREISLSVNPLSIVIRDTK